MSRRFPFRFLAALAGALIAGAADTAILPDRDQDGLPDATEDRNGNGRQDPGETDWQNADTDQDGSLDGEEVAGRTDPLNPASYIPKRLAAWWWDGPEKAWKAGDRGQLPLSGADGGRLTNGTFQAGIHFPSPAGVPLRYAVREPNGRLNARLDHGSVRLWFRPDWAWTNHPRTAPRLFEVGTFLNTNTGWWSWLFRPQPGDSPDVIRLQFAQAIGTYTSVRYWQPLERREWESPYWHELTLAYSPARTALWHNGRLHSAPLGNARAYFGDGVLSSNLPPLRTLTDEGFALGGDSTGRFGAAEGAIDSVETFNYPLGEVELFSRQQLAFRVDPSGPAGARLQLVRPLNGAALDVGAAAARPWALTLWRREPGSAEWGEALFRKSVAAIWTDESAVPGRAYEYRAQFGYSEVLGGATIPLTRHFVAGIAMPPTHRRGHVIVGVDSTLQSALKSDLAGLRTNLVGDGWSVTVLSAPRHDDRNWKANVRNLARFRAALADAARPGTTNVVFLLGHVVIPYSGTDPSDGHAGQTSGPWPCDAYHGYPDAAGFTDRDEFRADSGGVPNLPEDGRFDQNFLVSSGGRPSASVGRPPAWGVGRVDFAGLSVFGRLSEAELIRRYLAKDFRYRENRVPTAGRVSAHLGNPAMVTGAHSAQSFAGAAFGVEPGAVFSGYSLTDPIPADLGVHFQYAAGKGGEGVAEGRTAKAFASADFALPELEVPVTFRQVWFSYACNWTPLDPAGRVIPQENWLKASLGWPNYGLATLPGMLWDWAPLGAGAPLAALMTHGFEGQVAILRFQTILGDPTLRLHRVTPPANLGASRQGREVTLSWSASPDPGCVYFVYRSDDGLDGFGEPLGPPTAGLSIVDKPERLPALYQVRAARLQPTGSGSFTNLSQGVFVSLPRR